MRSIVRSMRSITLSSVACWTALLSGCGGSDGSTGVTPPHVTAQFTLLPHDAALPGDSLTISALVTADPGAGLHYIKFHAVRGLTYEDSVPLSGSGTQRIARTVLLPGSPQVFTVDVQATLVSDAQTLYEEDSIRVGNPAAPSLSYTVQPNENIEPGDTLTLTLSATAVNGLDVTRVGVGGSWSLEDSARWRGAPQATISEAWKVPASAIVGGVPMTVYMRAVDVRGLHSQATVTLTVSDTHAPRLTLVSSNPGSLTGPGGAYSPGDTAHVAVGASDNHRLSWIGWRVSGPFPAADSVAVSDSIVVSHVFALPVSQSWIGDTLVRVFARDATGGVADSASALDVRTLVSVAVTVVPVPAFLLKDLVVDNKRGTVYLSQYGNSTLHVLSLATRTLQPPLVVPGGYDQAETFGMGLSPSGDSLILSLRDTVRQRFAVVSLIDGVIDSILPLNQNGLAANVPVRSIVPITGGRVVMMLDSNYPYVAFLNYSTNRWAYSVTGLLLSSPNGLADLSAIAFAGGTRAALFLSEFGENCTQLVTAAPPRFSSCMDKGPIRGQLSASADGSRVVTWPYILDGTLATVGRFAPAVGDAVPEYHTSTITPDGHHIYAALQNGRVLELRASDGAIIGGFTLPAEPRKMAITADGATLIAMTKSQLFLVDLP